MISVLALLDLYFCPPHIRVDCLHFGIAEPQFPLADELEADITNHEQVWSLYEEFSTTLDQMCKEDWISFRQVAAGASLPIAPPF